MDLRGCVRLNYSEIFLDEKSRYEKIDLKLGLKEISYLNLE